MSLLARIKSVVSRIVRNHDLELLFYHYELARRAGTGQDTSFAGERRILEGIVEGLQLQDGFGVDIAASDGYSQSCMFGLFGNGAWSGLAVEMEPVKFSKLAFVYTRFPKVRLARTRVTPSNVSGLLDAFEVPRRFDVLNLDIDSYDLDVMQSILYHGFRPKVITMEINEKIPPGIYFTVNFDSHHAWQEDHFFGCSLDAASEVVQNFGYLLYGVSYNNAFFVEETIAPSHFVNLLPEDAYLAGYKISLTERLNSHGMQMLITG